MIKKKKAFQWDTNIYPTTYGFPQLLMSTTSKFAEAELLSYPKSTSLQATIQKFRYP